MEVQHRNGTTIYCLSNGAATPAWFNAAQRRNLNKTDANFRRRVEIIHDLDFPIASNKIRQSPDGRFIVATGTYAPRLRCYEMSDFGMKFERFLDSESIDFQFLGQDYGKLALLCDDRYIRFHAPYGHHTEMRIPTFGRAMGYESATCNLLIPACNGAIYRLDLEEGRFNTPLKPHADFEVSIRAHNSQYGGSCIAVSPTHQLTSVGCEDGMVRFWDNRSGTAPFVNLNVGSAVSNYGYAESEDVQFGNNAKAYELTSLAYDPSGVHMAIGTRGGCVALYDMRSSKPLYVKEHQYGLPIHTVRFHHGSDLVLSSDARLIKIWRAKSSSISGINTNETENGATLVAAGAMGSIVTNIEGKGDFTHFIVSGDELDPTGDESGLILCASEQPKLQSFYCPVLGRAPRWCSFLDNITEELEEKDREAGDDKVESVYEDHKFVTREEVEQLGVGNLVGTPLLRGYMHGFFMDTGMYNRIKAVANPFEYEEYRKKKIREKLEEKRASRIAPKASKKKTAAVNARLVARLEAKANKDTKASKSAKAMLEDNRFGKLFDNPDFEIDEDNEDFKLRNSSGVAQQKDDDMDSDRDDESSREDIDEDDEADGFIRVNDDEESESSAGDYSDSDNEDDGFRGAKVRGEAYEAMKALEKKQATIAKQERKRRAGKNVMYEADDFADSGKNALAIGLGDIQARTDAKRLKEESTLPLEKRLQLQKERKIPLVFQGEGVSKEVSFIPMDVKKKRKEEEEKRSQLRGAGRKRRDVKSLGLKRIQSGRRR